MESARRRARWKERLAATLLGLVAVLVVLELSLRVLGVACEYRDPTAARPGAGGPVVLCVGDSFTWGAGASPSMSWPRQLERLLHEGGCSTCVVVNRGLGGQNTASLLQNLQGNLDRVRPQLVVLCSGSANCWDPYGFHGAVSEGWAPPSALVDAFHRIRVVKLARLMLMAVRDAREKAEKARRVASLEADRKAHQERMDREVTADRQRRAQECWSQARRMWERGRSEQAAALYREGVAANPFLADNYLGLADCEEGQHRYAEAEQWCLKALQADPCSLEAHRAMIHLQRTQHRAAPALEWIVKARELAPRDATLLCLHGCACCSVQRYEEGQALIAEAMAVEPSRRAEFLVERAQVYDEMGSTDLARADLEEVLRHSPSDQRSRIILGDLLRREGKHAQALEAYARCTQSESRVQALLGRGACLQEMGRTRECLQVLEEAARLNPADAAEPLGDALRDAGREDEALCWYRKAAATNPSMAAEIAPKLVRQSPRPVSRPRPSTVAAIAPATAAEPATVPRPGQSASSAPLSPVEEWIRADLTRAIAMCRQAGAVVLMHSSTRASRFPSPCWCASRPRTGCPSWITRRCSWPCRTASRTS